MSAVLGTLETYSHGGRERLASFASAVGELVWGIVWLPTWRNEPSFFKTWRDVSCLY